MEITFSDIFPFLMWGSGFITGFCVFGLPIILRRRDRQILPPAR